MLWCPFPTGENLVVHVREAIVQMSDYAEELLISRGYFS